MFDALFVAIIFVAAVRGYVRGVLADVFGLAALLIAYLPSAPLAPLLMRWLLAAANWPASLAYLACRLAAGLVIYLVVSGGARAMARKLGSTDEGRLLGWNRALGALVGLGSGLLLALIVLFLADAGLKVYPEASGWAADAARDSVLRRRVSAVNPADTFLVTDVLRLLRAVRENPQVIERLRDDPQMRRLMEQESFQRLLSDEQLATALRSGRVHEVVASEEFRRLLADKELRKMALSPETRRALENVLGGPPSAGSALPGSAEQP